MKNRYYLIPYLIIVSVLLFSCIHEYADNDVEDKNAPFSAADAREFFESQIILGSTSTRSGTNSRGCNMLSPGEFTPQWEGAKVSQTGELVSVDVPIIAQYRYRGMQSKFQNGHASASIVNITQKLLVVKTLNNDKMSLYMLTLIPDKAYYKKNKNNSLDEFLNSGDKGSYSGIAIYSIPGLDIPIRVNRYVNGKKIGGILVGGIKLAHI